MAARQDGRRYDVPIAGERVWRLFWRLDGRRSGNGYAANAIGATEIEAAVRLTGETLRRWEVDALDAMEHHRLAWLNRDEEEDVVDEAQPLTPALMRALF